MLPCIFALLNHKRNGSVHKNGILYIVHGIHNLTAVVSFPSDASVLICFCI